MAEALQTADRLREAFASLVIPDLAANATVSIGVAMASDAGRNLQTLLATADRALYRAKAHGRNRAAPAPPMLVDVEPLGRDVPASGAAATLVGVG
jgi:diguanylate cyclase (GGDEF)-like protein